METASAAEKPEDAERPEDAAKPEDAEKPRDAEEPSDEYTYYEYSEDEVDDTHSQSHQGEADIRATASPDEFGDTHSQSLELDDVSSDTETSEEKRPKKRAKS